MNADHDPMRFAAKAHLRRHLTAVLGAVDMPEPTRAAAVEAVLAAGDVYCEDRPLVATVGGKPAPVSVHHAVLAIRQPYPSRAESTEVVR